MKLHESLHHIAALKYTIITWQSTIVHQTSTLKYEVQPFPLTPTWCAPWDMFRISDWPFAMYIHPPQPAPTTADLDTVKTLDYDVVLDEVLGEHRLYIVDC